MLTSLKCISSTAWRRLGQVGKQSRTDRDTRVSRGAIRYPVCTLRPFVSTRSPIHTHVSTNIPVHARSSTLETMLHIKLNEYTFSDCPKK